MHLWLLIFQDDYEEVGGYQSGSMSGPPISKSGPKLDPPKDDYNLFVGIFLWIGIGCLMPWNFFINGTAATNISWCTLQQETFNTDCTLSQTSLSSIKRSILSQFIWKQRDFFWNFQPRITGCTSSGSSPLTTEQLTTWLGWRMVTIINLVRCRYVH